MLKLTSHLHHSSYKAEITLIDEKGQSTTKKQKMKAEKWLEKHKNKNKFRRDLTTLETSSKISRRVLKTKHKLAYPQKSEKVAFTTTTQCLTNNKHSCILK
jgi:hypothetical protein